MADPASAPHVPDPAGAPSRGAGPKGPFLAGFLACFLPTLAAAALGQGRPGGVRQPVEFNHRKHVQEVGLECDACHTGYAKEAFSGLPSAEDCAICHGEPQGHGDPERALVERLKRGEALEWRPLFAQPPHVFFSHRRHVVAGQLGCPVCHGAIGESTRPPARVHRLAMQECIACHRASKVPGGCTTCHR